MTTQSSRLSRRRLLGAAAATLALPGLTRSSLAAPASAAPVFVFVFLRGGMDGLSAVIPYREARYYELRRGIAIARPGQGEDAAVDLDGQFALHPALAPLVPAFRAGELALVHAFGLDYETRSHFDAQDFIELGTPGDKRSAGWLTRLLSTEAFAQDPVPAVSFEGVPPRSLYGLERAFIIDRLSSVAVQREGDVPHAARTAFEKMYGSSAQGGRDEPVKQAGANLFGLLRRLEPLLDQPLRAEYPENDFAPRLADVARLIRGGIGTVFTLTVGSWDTHRAQGGARGPLAKRFRVLSESLAAFRADLGADMARTVVLLVTEFGRTVRENGTNGTDHGHGSVALVLGGPVRGGRVYGHWPGLAEEALYQGRDLAVTTDFRDVFSTIARGHLGVSAPASLFPGFESQPGRAPAILR